MKTLLGSILALLMILAGSLCCFAAGWQGGSIVNALVGVEARVSVVSEPMDMGWFSGLPNEEIPPGPFPADNAQFEVEANSDVTLHFSGTDLTCDADTIKTSYRAAQSYPYVLLNFFNRDDQYAPCGEATTSQPAKTTRRYHIYGRAKSGPTISSQKAGHYTATITLTVSSP
ncbi:MAG: hypothetical protein K6U11_12205 [bacterium]|nr:hypothetical protein [bacterium]